VGRLRFEAQTVQQVDIWEYVGIIPAHEVCEASVGFASTRLMRVVKRNPRAGPCRGWVMEPWMPENHGGPRHPRCLPTASGPGSNE